MKRLIPLLTVLIVLTVGLSGCDFVGDVIEFSLWTILILVLVVILLVYAFIKSFLD